MPMPAKKKPAPKTTEHVDAAAPARETMVAKQVIDRRVTKKAAIDSAYEHLKAHGLDNPWSAYNAGGTCGVCGERI
jgi:hypothetical protein